MLFSNTFAAPWSRSLTITTVASTVLLTSVFLIGVLINPFGIQQWDAGMLAIPVAIIGLAALFTIRSYRIEGTVLRIQRLGWSSTLDLSQLVSAEVDPKAMNKSIRLFGNGGLFCFAGLFRNKHLGNYRAFATNPQNAVVLRFPKRTVVVTPEDPHGFAEVLSENTQI